MICGYRTSGVAGGDSALYSAVQPALSRIVQSGRDRVHSKQTFVRPDEIRLMGPTAALERALVCGDDGPGGSVTIFDREWCRLRDSNPRPHHYE